MKTTKTTPDDLRRFLGLFNTDSVLRTISLASGYLLANNQAINLETGVPITVWNLAYLAKEALRSASGEFLKPFETQDLLKAARLYECLPEPIEVADPITNRHEPYKSFIRIANLQFPTQEPWFFGLARSATLFVDMPRMVKRGPEFDIDAGLRASYGLSAEEIIRIGALIMAAFHQPRPSPVVDLKGLSTSEIPFFSNELQYERLCGFAKAFAITKEEFRAKAFRKVVLSGYEKYAFNELQETPLVRMGNQRLCLPVHMYLAQLIAWGLYFLLADIAKGDRKENPFRTKFGYLFEEYIGLQLKDNISGFKIIPAIRYAGDKSSPDWILTRGQDAILIECKSSHLTVGAKTYADGTFLDKDAERIWKKSLRQVCDFVEYVERSPRTIPELENINRFFSLIVSYFPLYLANSAYQEMYGPAIRNIPAKLMDYQFLSVMEFEDLLGVLDKVDILSLLESRSKSGEDSPSEFGQFLSETVGAAKPNTLLCRKTEELIKWSPLKDVDEIPP